MKKTLLWLSLIPFTKVQVSAAVTCGIQTAFRDGDSSQECAADAYLSVFAECQRADPDLGNLNAVVCSCNAARDAEEASAVAASNACAASCNYQECLPGCFTDLKLARAGHSNRYCNCLGAAACGKPSMSSPSTTPTELVSSTVSTETSTPASAVPPINPTPAPSSPPKCTAPYTPGSCPSVTNKGSKKCIDQHQRAMQSPGEISTNGCGPEARDFLDVLLQASLLLFATEFRRACNKHDICFGTCSLGNDQHFDQCNSVFRKDMLDTCTFYAPLALQNGLYERCLARAEIVYLAVQYQGCGPYAKAQDAACQCVNCDKNGETSSNPLEIYLPSDVVRIACGPAMDIGRDWPSFVDAVNAASSTANAEDKAALAFYASTIGIDSASVSPQITTFSRGCGSTNRRRWMSSGNKRQVVPSSRLVLFFKSFVSTDAADYGCGTSSDQQLCEVANALLGIAAVARRIDNYAGGSSTAISSGTSMLPATSMMSSDMDSSSLEPSATSRTIPNTDRSSEFGSSTASTITQPSAPSSSMSLTVSTMTSDVVQNGSHTAPLASPSSLSKYRTGDMPPEASRVTITASSVPTETTSPCVLIKHFGDSPDTPDSPDGEPEATEIPDFPGGYYYLCADGSIPPLSILPGFSVPASSGTAAPSSTAPIATAPPANVSQPSCKMTRFKGDSPDTPDTPDSPGDQPEVPELPEISQDPSDPGYYWMCV